MNWLSDANNIPTNDHAAFNPTIDPSVAFLQGTPSTIDPTQFQNPQLFNGTTRNASPAFQTPVYQVNSVVPSKRPRPREDSLGASPRQAPGSLPGQRSQTPHQSHYANYNGSTNGNPGFAQPPTPYQHLQQGGSSNATPSPIMQNQHFNSNGMPQRVQTSSPSPFPSGGSHMGSQMSPPPQDQGSRVNTPQNNIGGYMAGLPYGQGFNQNFGSPAMNPNGMQASLQPPPNNPSQSLQQQQMNVQRSYQMRMQQQAQLAAAQGRPMGSGMNAMANAMGQMQNPQMARQIQQNAPRQGGSSEEFLKRVQQFMSQRGLPFDPSPVISGRPLNLALLWQVIIRHQGSAKVTAQGLWPRIAQFVQFEPTAAQEIQAHYQRNLAQFEGHYIQGQQGQRGQQLNEQRPRQATDMSGIQNQISPVKQQHVPGRDQSPHQSQQLPQFDPSNPLKPIPPSPNNVHSASMNGFATSQPNRQMKQPNIYNQPRPNLSRQPEGTPPNASQGPFPNQSPAPPGKRPNSMAEKTLQGPDQTLSQMPPKTPIEDPFKPAVLPESRHHGPIVVDEMAQLASEIEHLKPTVPHLMELGVIDIHAITMSIKCGIHAEVRVALDTLTTISVDHNIHLLLSRCEDLVESMIDCAEDQLEALAENAAEVSDVMLISSYEDVVRGCRAEIESIQDVPAMGTLDYDLDRNVDRLVCITTIIRNFSFHELNHVELVKPFVVKFLATVIRYLGTRNMLLRTHRNTLDFMKDVVTFLSNVSQSIELPGKEEALCLLHFLLSFAPCPPPILPGKDVLFTFYNPNVHKYTPPAIDSLAKLLARDEPNRTYYKAIFAADSSSNPPYDLMTRTFALAIAPLPDPHRRAVNRNVVPLIEHRKPFLLQGLLAAEILANLAPGPETGVPRSWLASSDGFAVCLLRLVNLLATDRAGWAPPPPQQQRGGRTVEPESSMYNLIVYRGLSVLHRLVEKSKNPDNPNDTLPPGIFPTKVNLMGALGFKDIDPQFLRRLCAYAALED